MAGNEIKLILRVDDKGSLNIVAKEAKAAANATDKLDKSTKNANKSRSGYQKVEKGVAGATSNSTKAFSKQAQAIGGGLVPAYAVLAANVFAITAAFGVLQRSAAVAQLTAGLIAVGNAAGQNLPFVASQLKVITGAAVSTEQAMRATAVAISAGFSTDQLNKLANVAKGASLALGRDMGDALDRLVRGTAKLEPEILDELGIMVRLDDAVTDYAIGLNKSSDSLTQFERRQAFLNATIEQGSKKFSEISNVVEVNPYDKLSAAFSDLSHTIIEVVSKGLVPLIEILSSNPLALAGAMAAFGGSLVRTILPSIQATAEGQRELAAAAIQSSKKAGKVVAANYQKLSRDINKMEMRPPSVVKLEKDFNKSAVSAEQLKRNISTVTGQITKKGNAIIKLKGLTDSASKERIAQLKLEESQLVALKTQLIALQNEEGKRSTGTRKAKGLQTGGRMARRESAGLNAIDSAGYVDGIGIAAKQSKRQFAEIGKASGGVNKAGAAFKAATSSAKLFGSALLRMIPIIGQVMFVVSALAPFFSDIFKTSKVKAATTEVLNSFQSIVTIAQRLNKVIGEESNTAFEKYKATLMATTGVLGQLEAGLTRVNSVRQTEITSQIEELGIKLAQQNNIIKIAQEDLEKFSKVAGMADSIAAVTTSLNRAKASAADFKIEMAELAAGLDKIDKVSTEGVLQGFISILENTSIGGQMTSDLEAVRKVLADVKSGLIKTPAQLAAATKALSEGSREVLSGMSGVADTFKALRDETQTLGQKAPTQFSKVRKALKELSNEANSVGGLSLDAFEEMAKGAKSNFYAVEAAILKVGKQVVRAKTDANMFAAAFRTAAEAMQENEATMITSAASAAILSEQAKQLAKFSKANEFIMTKRLELETASTQQLLEGKEAQRDNMILAGTNLTQQEEYAKLQKEILALEEKIKDTAEQTNLIATARVEGAKRLNDMLGKQLSMEKGILDARDKTSKIKIEARRGRSGSNAQDELDIFNSSKAERLALEQKLFEQKVRGIDIQYKLLDLQFELEGIKLSNIMKAQEAPPAEIDAAMASITAARTLTAAGRSVAMELEHAKVGAKYDPTNRKKQVKTE